MRKLNGYSLLREKLDKVYHVVAYTGVLGIDGDMTPRSVDRRCLHADGSTHED